MEQNSNSASCRFVEILGIIDVKCSWVMGLKGKGNVILAAIFIGAILPAVIFSVVEKMYADKHNEDAISSTSQAIQNTEINSVAREEFVSVLQPNGTVLNMEMNTYLTGVLLGEMPSDFDSEALKAQAVVARTYTLKRNQSANKHTRGAICTESSCCQSYCSPEDYLLEGGKKETIEKFQKAVADTAGQVVTYQGKLIEATYFSCSGGKTEDAQAVWGTQIPYLQAVDSPGEEIATHYQDYVQFNAKELSSLLGIAPTGKPVTWFGSVTYTPGGGVDTIVVAGKVFTGVELRQKLGLYSTAFSIIPAGETVHIYTKGFGHRVGMSQYGAEAMAVSGSDYTQILAHYYPGTELDSYLD